MIHAQPLRPARRRRLVRAAAALAVGLWLAATPDAALAQQISVYSVTLSGSVSGMAFTRSGYLYVNHTVDVHNASGTGVNPLDFSLLSGAPFTAPSRGAINFATNTALLPQGGGAALDVTYMTYTQTPTSVTFNMTIAPYISYAGLMESFNANGGLTARVYCISGGTATYTFSASRLTGTLNIKGRDYVTGEPATYSATVTGYRVQ